MTSKPIVINDLSNCVINPRFELLKENDHKKPFRFTSNSLDKREDNNKKLHKREKPRNAEEKNLEKQNEDLLSSKSIKSRHINHQYKSSILQEEKKTSPERVEKSLKNPTTLKDGFSGNAYLNYQHVKDNKYLDHTVDSNGFGHGAETSLHMDKYLNKNNYLNSYANTNNIPQSSFNKNKNILLNLKNLKFLKLTKPHKVNHNPFHEDDPLDSLSAHKTHFKAASMIALSSNFLNSNNKNKNQMKLEDSRTLNKTQRSSLKFSDSFNVPKNSSKQNNKLKRKSESDLDKASKNNMNIFNVNNNSKDFMSKFSNLEENLDIIKYNPLLYNTNINKKKSEDNRNNPFDSNELKYLKKIIENKNREEAIEAEKRGIKFFKKLKLAKKTKTALIAEDPNTFFMKYGNEELVPSRRDEERIWVNNQPISKAKIDLIAQKVLKTCNFIHGKNKNNDSTLRKGEGKVMITSGLSVKEFGMKFKLPI